MSTLSESYKDFPLNLHHILPLDFQSVKFLPDSHSWPKINDFPTAHVRSDNESIPIIDLMATNLVEHVGYACEKWGVFQIVNHGIPTSLLSEVESYTEKLFALPTQQKVKALRSLGGATGYGAARISPFFSKFMWHEGFTIMGSPVDHARELWLHDYENFCDVMEDYQNKMKSLSHQLFLLILKSLGATEEDMKTLFFSSTTKYAHALQLNSYPKCPDPNHAIGLAPHTDSLFLTILHQNDTNGLQIYRDNGVGWVSVSPIDGALTVNIGDLLHILSNARFPTVYHRAVVNQMKQRLSVAFFYGPPVDSDIGPFVKLPFPLYRCLSVKEYISIKGKHLEKALSLIRL